MADTRVHPHQPSASSTSPKNSGEQQILLPNPAPSKPVPPPPATYVVQLPREQVLRYPPPENARKYQSLTRRKRNRSCCCYTACLLLLLVIAAAVSAGVLYLVFRFKSPKYAVTGLAIGGMNLTSAAPISPRFNLTIRAENPNRKVDIDYVQHSSINVFYEDVRLSGGGGEFPAFRHPRRNVTVVRLALSGSDVVLGGTVRAAMRRDVSRGRVPFVVRTNLPVRVKVGKVRTWEIRVRVKCDVVLDGVSEGARVVDSDCDYSVRLW